MPIASGITAPHHPGLTPPTATGAGLYGQLFIGALAVLLLRRIRLENRSCSRFWPAWTGLWWRRSLRFDSTCGTPLTHLVGVTAALTLCYRHQMRWLLLIRVFSPLTMLGLAVAWLTGTTMMSRVPWSVPLRDLHVSR